MKISKVIYATFLCTAFLMGSCGDESDDTSDDVTTTDDVVTTDDNSGSGDDDGTADETPDVSNFTGYNQPATDVEGWELVFEDEFDGDLSSWSVWTGGAFNNELQHYQEDNLLLEEGILSLSLDCD